MVQSPKILLVLGLMASVASMTAPVRAFVAEEETTLQPKALKRTGIYALRDIDPNLTGTGVQFAVISRSITYIDDEPQNDYRPSIGHNCFKGMELSFHNQDKPLPAISPHSTAICSATTLTHLIQSWENSIIKVLYHMPKLISMNSGTL
ncbi:MAG: hypothetical protein ACYTDW_01145 [Planctomycetota bacterium]|jgi:hypothetical protein